MLARLPARPGEIVIGIKKDLEIPSHRVNTACSLNVSSPYSELTPRIPARPGEIVIGIKKGFGNSQPPCITQPYTKNPCRPWESFNVLK